MTDFRNFYTIEKLRLYKAAHDASLVKQQGKTPAPEQEALVAAWIRELCEFNSALEQFVRHKGRSGELTKVPFVAGRRLRWADQWNRLVTGEETKSDLEEPMLSGAGLMAMALLVHSDGGPPRGSLSEMFDELIVRINDGKHVEPNSAYSVCGLTSQVLHMQMASGWKPRYGTYDHDLRFVPLQNEASEPSVQHNTIAVPSGESGH